MQSVFQIATTKLRVNVAYLYKLGELGMPIKSRRNIFVAFYTKL